MAIKTTTWSPDTCDCVLHYSWDDEVPQDERVHTPVIQVVTHRNEVKKTMLCKHHLTQDLVEERDAELLAEPDLTKKVEIQSKKREMKDSLKVQEHYQLIVEENSRKNLAVLETKQLFGVEPEWDFDDNRDLKIKLGNTHTSKDKGDLLNVLKTKVSSKIIVE